MNYWLGGFLFVTIILMAKALPYPQSLEGLPGSGSGNSTYSSFLQSLKKIGKRRIKDDGLTAFLEFTKYIEKNGINDKARCIFIKVIFNIVTDEVGELVYSIFGSTLDKIRNFGPKIAGDSCNKNDLSYISKDRRLRKDAPDDATVFFAQMNNFKTKGVNPKTVADFVESETWEVVNELAEAMDPLIHPFLVAAEKIGYAIADGIRELDVNK